MARNFQRKIRPHEAVEIYSRGLSWNREWLCLVNYIVKKATKLKQYRFQHCQDGSQGDEASCLCDLGGEGCLEAGLVDASAG